MLSQRQQLKYRLRACRLRSCLISKASRKFSIKSKFKMRHQNDHLPKSPSSCLTRETEHIALYPSLALSSLHCALYPSKAHETLPNQSTLPGNHQLCELHVSPRAAQPPRQSFRDRGLRHTSPHGLRSPLRSILERIIPPYQASAVPQAAPHTEAISPFELSLSITRPTGTNTST